MLTKNDFKSLVFVILPEAINKTSSSRRCGGPCRPWGRISYEAWWMACEQGRLSQLNLKLPLTESLYEKVWIMLNSEVLEISQDSLTAVLVTWQTTSTSFKQWTHISEGIWMHGCESRDDVPPNTHTHTQGGGFLSSYCAAWYCSSATAPHANPPWNAPSTAAFMLSKKNGKM